MEKWTLIFLLILINASSVFAVVKVNEIESNPPGSDNNNTEWIELYNTGIADVNLTEWKIVDNGQKEKFLSGVIGANGFFVIFPGIILNNVNENITLMDQFNNTIDISRTFSDSANNNNTWQRKQDGFDTDNDSDWIFALSTFNSSNSADLIPPAILDQTVNLNPIFETDDIILGCLINESNLEEAIIQGNWEGNFQNFRFNKFNKRGGKI